MELDFNKTLMVHNPTMDDFTRMWDKIPYTVKAGDTKEFPEHIAKHIAKHLVNRIMLSKNLSLRSMKRVEITKEVIFRKEEIVKDEPIKVDPIADVMSTLDSINMKELRALAKARKIKVPAGIRKSELYELVFGKKETDNNKPQTDPEEIQDNTPEEDFEGSKNL